jgi:hypothetical protein
VTMLAPFGVALQCTSILEKPVVQANSDARLPCRRVFFMHAEKRDMQSLLACARDILLANSHRQGGRP